jgi:tetraacyldisaccharide 4'-kinase
MVFTLSYTRCSLKSRQSTQSDAMITLNSVWYDAHPIRWVLWPVSQIYRLVITVRRWCYRVHIKKTVHFSTPIIVVGNLTVGGTGKSPLTSQIAKWLLQKGYRVGLVSRGYGGQSTVWPREVTADIDATLVGDEAVMLVRQTGCPMVVGPDRVAAVKKLLSEYELDFVISDDGLQHLALGRQIEIVLIDGDKKLGNNMLLPAGPLRESASRLKSVDFVVQHGGTSAFDYTMRLIDEAPYHLLTEKTVDWSYFKGKHVIAMAAIGSPDRFFSSLERHGVEFERRVYPDHHHFQQQDIVCPEDSVILMTEKDAVKCRGLDQIDRCWCVPVCVELDESFYSALESRLSSVS